MNVRLFLPLWFVLSCSFESNAESGICAAKYAARVGDATLSKTLLPCDVPTDGCKAQRQATVSRFIEVQTRKRALSTVEVSKEEYEKALSMRPRGYKEQIREAAARERVVATAVKQILEGKDESEVRRQTFEKGQIARGHFDAARQRFGTLEQVNSYLALDLEGEIEKQQRLVLRMTLAEKALKEQFAEKAMKTGLTPAEVEVEFWREQLVDFCVAEEFQIPKAVGGTG